MMEVALNPPQSASPYQHNQVIPVNGRQMLLPTTEYTHAFSPTYPAVAYGWERNLQAHETGQALADEIGAEMLIVLIPPKEEAYAEFLVEQYGQEYIDAIGESRRMLFDVCEERGWHCLDALPAFQEAIRDGETIYYALDFHLNDSGNRVLAQAIQDYIAENGLLTEE
jgi:SGNH hydrolase-like domain, acetyltransferase AlgX